MAVHITNFWLKYQQLLYPDTFCLHKHCLPLTNYSQTNESRNMLTLYTLVKVQTSGEIELKNLTNIGGKYTVFSDGAAI